ncbi:SMI1/KNR4 family protein [Nocardia yamanashiensis]|uniref:SMI1/KNR4 family protein n=1 Tax=Nocardia yamanashiensis TaxID=209247 RepID=UPI0012FD3652|nr:SMI1/KNR4 family protein [Nocardia yamanashiensis]
MVVGASDDEIDRMLEQQRARAIPVAAREVFRVIGKDPGIWYSGALFGVSAVNGEEKQEALAGLDDAADHALSDPGGMLVLAEIGSYNYVIVDGKDLDEPDPPLWLLHESGTVEMRWPSVTDWFAAAARIVADRKRKLAEDRSAGFPDVAREAYFRW